jgi:hypothetical protein
MPDHDRLSSLILAHWERYHPRMLRQLQQENQLEATLQETAEQFSSLLYELMSVRKMQHHQAWEVAVNQFLKPEESFSTSPKEPPETSASPMPSGSEWVDRTKKRKATSKPSGS